MICPECFKRAIPEGECPEIEDKSLLAWFCFDCGLMKRMFRTDQEEWVKVSKEAIAVLLGDDMLEDRYKFYYDRWNWDTGDEESKEWMNILGEEIRKRRTYTEAQVLERMQRTRIIEDQHRYRIYIDGVWK